MKLKSAWTWSELKISGFLKHSIAILNVSTQRNASVVLTRYPIYGVPRLTAELKRRGFNINHKRVRRLQKALGLRTIYSRPHFNTSEPHPEHKKFPYLLKGLKIDYLNQVWSTDITYTAVDGHRAFVIGIVDWFSRKLMAYNVVNTMDAFHCVETLRMAIERFGKPEI